MERDRISSLAHRDHPIAAPISAGRMRRLIDRLPTTAGTTAGRALDLGCGSGEWLLAVLAARPGMRGVGVDTSASAL